MWRKDFFRGAVLFNFEKTRIMESEHYYHFATKGLEEDILFGSVEEFIAGMNRIALCLCRLGKNHPVIVICFCLMDNHVHFILYGLEEDCILFMENYKQTTELWLRHHGGDNLSGKTWQIGHWLIPDKERLRTTIAYIHRNPTAAGLAVSPAGYRWSSASLMYTDNGWMLEFGRKIGTLSIYERRRVLHSKTAPPADWVLLPNGLIWPGNYVNTKVMERQFDSVRDYQFVLNKRVEEEVNLEMHSQFVSLPDGEVRSRAKTLAGALFGCRKILALNVQQRLDLAKLLKKETGSATKQVARVVHLKMAELEPILNPRRG